MKICITGGRNFGRTAIDVPPEKLKEEEARALAEEERLNNVLDSFREMFVSSDQHLELAHGGAPGADMLADEWAKAHGIPSIAYMADWKGYGRSAGPVRNRQMLEQFRPDFVIAFPGGSGTFNCCQTARLLRIPVLKVAA